MKYSESNKPLVCMQTNSTCYKGTTMFTPKGVLWHSTGANNPTIKRYVQPSENDANYEELMRLLGENKSKNDWNHINRRAGLNCWIGKLADGTVTTVQTMPWNYRPWGCGSGSKGSCNNTHIQFEICEDSLNDKTYFDKVYNEACEITAYLCKMYNIDPFGTFVYNGVTVPTILCHADSCKLKLGSNHGDVLHWFKKYNKTMDDVRKDVAKLMDCGNAVVTPTAPAVTGTPSTGSEADEKKIWDYFMKKIGNAYGVAGLMGNLFAESSLRSNNMQNSYEGQLGYNDKTYTEAVDNGTYTNFVKDGVGYGLAQFTFYTLKQDLLDYARSKKKSVGDFDMQLDFLAAQLSTNFKKVWNDLKTTQSVLEASNSVLLNFERPASKDSAETQNKRAAFGQKYYDKYANNAVKFAVGDEVKLVSGATYYNGDSISSWVFNKTLYVREVNGDNIAISTLKTGAITGRVKDKYLKHIESVIEDNKVATNMFNIGDEVKLIPGATYTSGKGIPAWLFSSKLYVRAINGDKITVSVLKIGAITGTVNANFLVDYNALMVGDTVKLVSDATYYNGTSIPSWVFGKTLYVREVNGDKVVISTLKTGAVTGSVNKKNLRKC